MPGVAVMRGRGPLPSSLAAVLASTEAPAEDKPPISAGARNGPVCKIVVQADLLAATFLVTEGGRRTACIAKPGRGTKILACIDSTAAAQLQAPGGKAAKQTPPKEVLCSRHQRLGIQRRARSDKPRFDQVGDGI